MREVKQLGGQLLHPRPSRPALSLSASIRLLGLDRHWYSHSAQVAAHIIVARDECHQRGPFHSCPTDSTSQPPPVLLLPCLLHALCRPVQLS